MPLKALLEDVSDHLGNTPAIARKSYVHPAVLALVEGQEEWRKTLRLPRATRWLSRHERGLIAHLEDGPAAVNCLPPPDDLDQLYSMTASRRRSRK